MQYTIYGISHDTFRALHDYYLPRTIVTSSYWNNDEELFTITITNNAIIKINDGRLTIDLGAKLFSIDYELYHGFTVT